MVFAPNLNADQIEDQERPQHPLGFIFTASHKINARRHAQRRAKERYGIDISIKLIRRHEYLISKKWTKCVGLSFNKKRGNSQVHAIRYNDITLLAVYSFRSKCICTYLPNDGEF